MDKRQVIVIGAGPGGSTAAFYLAKAGVDVLMVDKETWPRDKACGDLQAAASFEVYKDMGIYDEALKASPNPNSTLYRYSGVDEEIVMLDMANLPAYCGWITPRRIIDDIVRRGAIRGGADFMEDFEVTDLIIERGYVKGVRGLYRGKRMDIRADAVVIANGSHSMQARQVGVFNEDPDKVFYAARGYFENVGGIDMKAVELHYPEGFYPAGYMWVFPENEERKVANIGAFITQRSLIKSGMRLEDFFPWWRDNTKIGKERLGQARLLGEIKGWKIPSCYKAGDNVVNGAILVGDAGNAIESSGGGGYSLAINTGKIAAEVLAKALAEGDVSKERLLEHNRLVSKNLDPIYQQCKDIRDSLYSTPERFSNFLKTAKATPGYPDAARVFAALGAAPQA